MDECTYEGHQYGRKYVLLVLSSASSASSIFELQLYRRERLVRNWFLLLRKG